ncbi:unnamed protein product [Didymodactylos carnosus]|uniref:Uncharacterized protein n=1 Tax=Didymodactylos carnosus TaxID=1234261 RepID=A0A814F4W7_9BILA|nr:unnamed protein product [Didymodactylos carnosus]CAF3750957.1 unnamed protein product [Didymodactylos carnosus]
MCCKLTVKSLSDTRWESHVNAVSALKTGLKGIYSALKEVLQKDSLTRITAEPVDAKKKFKIKFFDILITTAIASMKGRFESFTSIFEPFEFLYNIKECDEMKEKQLKEKCRSLEKTLSDKENKDIEAEELEIELKLLSRKIEEDSTPETVFKYIYNNNFEELFPNALIALRVL